MAISHLSSGEVASLLPLGCHIAQRSSDYFPLRRVTDIFNSLTKVSTDGLRVSARQQATMSIAVSLSASGRMHSPLRWMFRMHSG